MRENDHKGNRVLYITRSGELLFWLIIILICVSFFSLGMFFKEKKNNDYSIYMPDVDGLIVGSPVRTMGIEIGYVTKIKPTNEEVYVKFVITNDDITIPRGTIATVEFTGLAGSKSLELYMPDENTYIDKDTPIISVNPPKRLHDAIGLLDDMYKKLTSIIYSSMSFSEKINFINIHSGSNEALKDFLIYSEKFLDETNAKTESFGSKINNYNKKKFEER